LNKDSTACETKSSKEQTTKERRFKTQQRFNRQQTMTCIETFTQKSDICMA